MANEGSKIASQPASQSADKAMDDVLGAVAKLITGMETMYERIGALEARFDGGRRVTMARGGGTHEGSGAEKISASEFQDGQSFFDKSPDQANGRYSCGSTGSNFGSKDPGTKLERPKFVVKQTKVKEGVKSETVQFSDYLEFFDEYEQYMDAWETIPTNFIEGVPQKYPNRERVAVLNIPFKYAQMLSDRLKTIYNRADLQHMSLKEIQAATYWKDLSTTDVRKRIGQKFEAEVSVKGSLDILRRIEFKSQFGLIDGIAFATYQHDLKKETSRGRVSRRTLEFWRNERFEYDINKEVKPFSQASPLRPLAIIVESSSESECPFNDDVAPSVQQRQRPPAKAKSAAPVKASVPAKTGTSVKAAASSKSFVPAETTTKPLPSRIVSFASRSQLVPTQQPVPYVESTPSDSDDDVFVFDKDADRYAPVATRTKSHASKAQSHFDDDISESKVAQRPGDCKSSPKLRSITNICARGSSSASQAKAAFALFDEVDCRDKDNIWYQAVVVPLKKKGRISMHPGALLWLAGLA